MKTVKDFKDAGLEFVANGDVFQVVGGANPFTINQVWVINAAMSDWCDAQEAVSFAWRINTGVKPKFRGMVEVGGEFGPRFGIVAAFGCWWTDGTIKKWRPYLPSETPVETPEEKEAFDRWPSETRIDVIEQNGNDGLHYDNTNSQFESLAKDRCPVHDVAYDESGWRPGLNEVVFLPCLVNDELYSYITWTGSEFCITAFERGICHKAKEGAIAQANAMLASIKVSK